MSQVSNIVEVFGSFVVVLADGPAMFSTHAEAISAETEFLKGAEFRNLAADYCSYKGLCGKNAKGKANVIVDFLVWIEAGQPTESVSAMPSTDDFGVDEAYQDEFSEEQNENTLGSEKIEDIIF